MFAWAKLSMANAKSTAQKASAARRFFSGRSILALATGFGGNWRQEGNEAAVAAAAVRQMANCDIVPS